MFPAKVRAKIFQIGKYVFGDVLLSMTIGRQ